MDPGGIALNGGLWVAIPVAIAAGLISFLSPCVLPLVPGYLGYVSGVTGGAQRTRGRMVAGAGLFVAGFSVVFLAIFVIAGAVGTFFTRYQDVILVIGGVVIIILGLAFIGQFTFLQRTMKPSWRPRSGLIGAPLLGVVFAIGWTPCIGPTLATVSTLAFTGNTGRALTIGLAYCLGLGIPFVLVALGFGWVSGSVAWVKRHIRAVNIIGGAILVAIGVFMVTGVWGALLSSVGAVVSTYDLPL
ncbi:MAG TPA: cytochrome c biogenesis protein CcdA [Pseudolysinimonas sp.]|nr:cytochrome c biogenesis protein CcdA [Pseudolysinimonas sp.]